MIGLLFFDRAYPVLMVAFAYIVLLWGFLKRFGKSYYGRAIGWGILIPLALAFVYAIVIVGVLLLSAIPVGAEGLPSSGKLELFTQLVDPPYDYPVTADNPRQGNLSQDLTVEPGGREVALYFTVWNYGESVDDEPIQIYVHWPSPALRFSRWTFEGAAWSMVTVDPNRFILEIPGGLAIGRTATAMVAFYPKCGLNNAVFTVSTGANDAWYPPYTRNNTLRIVERHSAEAVVHNIDGKIRYSDGDVPQSGNVTVRTWCGTKVANASVVDGVFFVPAQVLADGVYYSFDFTPSQQERDRRWYNPSSLGYGFNVFAGDMPSGTGTFHFEGEIPVSVLQKPAG